MNKEDSDAIKSHAVAIYKLSHKADVKGTLNVGIGNCWIHITNGGPWKEEDAVNFWIYPENKLGGCDGTEDDRNQSAFVSAQEARKVVDEWQSRHDAKIFRQYSDNAICKELLEGILSEARLGLFSFYFQLPENHRDSDCEMVWILEYLGYGWRFEKGADIFVDCEKSRFDFLVVEWYDLEERK